MTKNRFNDLMATRQKFIQMAKHHKGKAKMERVVVELKATIDEIEMELLQLLPPSINKDIRRCLEASVIYFNPKTQNLQQYLAKAFRKNGRLVWVRPKDELLYPQNVM